MTVDEFAREHGFGIVEVKRELRHLGYASLPPDARFPPKERAAVIQALSRPVPAAVPTQPIPVEPLSSPMPVLAGVSIAGASAARRAKGLPHVFLHGDVLEYFTDDTDATRRRRFNWYLRELLACGSIKFKATKGAAAGWRRSQLGGTNGMQFYLWWAPAGSRAVEQAKLESHSILVRHVRHHDTLTVLDPGGPDDRLSIEVSDAISDEAFTPAQQAVVGATESVVVLRGQAGTGKTVALCARAERLEGRILYVTHSRGLVDRA